MAVTEQEFRRFADRAAEFAKTHPDFNAALADAASRGLNLSRYHTDEIIRLAAPEVAYDLARPESESEARLKFHVAEGEHINEDRARDAIRRKHSRLVRNQTYQTAGQLQGEQREMAEFLEKRREDFRTGKRRRR